MAKNKCSKCHDMHKFLKTCFFNKVAITLVEKTLDWSGGVHLKNMEVKSDGANA